MLRELDIVDSPDSVEFDATVELAAHFFECQFSVITLLDKDDQWFKAKHGLDIDHTERQHAFCNHTIRKNDLFVVSDASKDERFSQNPYVIGKPGIRFYAGCPISIDGIHALGAFCIIDTKPREFSQNDGHQLLRLRLPTGTSHAGQRPTRLHHA